VRGSIFLSTLFHLAMTSEEPLRLHPFCLLSLARTLVPRITNHQHDDDRRCRRAAVTV
jgi:hypothetical protein